ncbi:uncharacterized protein LOC123673817 [Harmonia axyridis]|uniref:uncharacterized protein LOC123673817 n=1 Tax=Harmonia axyridis TaxID=115357 RepID=UPI001E275086|nr:uncharacterized protein LOC123673817 [Harmonia axyridis]
MGNMECTKCSGMIRDAMKDLLYLLGTLTDEEGNLKMSELDLQAEVLSEEEISAYLSSDLDLNNLMKGMGANDLLFNGNKSDIFKHRFLFPSLIVHDVNSSLDNINEWNIPARATAKLSIRTFHKSVNETFNNVKNFLEKCWSERGCNNKLTISLDKIHETWNADVDNVHYVVAAKSIQYVYQKPTLFLNNDYTIPIVDMLQTIVGKSILLLPILSEECYINEMVPKSNYLNASKMFASYLYEMGGIPNITSKSSTSFTSCQSVPEICVCGKLEEGIQAASGDSEGSRPDAQKNKNISDEENNCVCPYRPQVQTKDVAVLSDDLPEKILPPPIPKPCKCTSKFYGAADVEKISLLSTVSTASRTPNPVTKKKEAVKKIVTPSVDTIKCSCVPNRFRDLVRKEENIISPEEEEVLMKSMRSTTESEKSGFSSCKYPSDRFKTPKMKILGCVCPEKSQESVYDIEIQKDRMFCPVITGPIEICNKGGKRRHHITGPAPTDEEETEIISLGPLSHCSCSEDSVVVVPLCDCPINSPVHTENIDEVD